jgi:8-amino-7-oxononanoate synthase
VRTAAAEAASEWGAGATGSRLTTGSLALHSALEAELAALKGAEGAVLFGSGYEAAVGTIPALVGRGDLILSDSLNHASLIDGCRLSRAEVRVYRHRDVDHARELLADRSSFRRCLLVSDGVFSMDGDLAPLPELCDLCDAFDTWLMVDDAHGTGVLGERGGGTVEHFGLEGRVPVQMGTLSKALGSQGGFVAGSAALAEYLRNRARTFIFSTAPTPAAAAAARASLRIVREEPQLRTGLLRRAAYLRKGLRSLGFDVPEGETPIVPVLVGESDRALALAAVLEEEGVWAPAIRPPTVPSGTARLRLCVQATHEGQHLEYAHEAFVRARGILKKREKE